MAIQAHGVPREGAPTIVIRHQESPPAGELAWSPGSWVEDLFDIVSRPAWYADAACREHPELRWVGSGNSGPEVEAAMAVCANCLVRTECLAAAMADPTLVGVWGGTTTKERQARHRRSRGRPGQDDQSPITPALTSAHAVARARHLTSVRASTVHAPTSHETELPPPMPDKIGNAQSNETKGRNVTNRAVIRYLDWLAGKTPAPKSTRRTVEGELAKVEERLSDPGITSARRLKLLQDRRNLQTHGLPMRGRPPSEERIVDGFITHGAAYGRMHSITYESFIEFGVPAEILDKADIHPLEP